MAQCQAAELDANTRLVLLALWAFTDLDGWTFASELKVREHAGLGERTTRTALGRLERADLVAIVRPPSPTKRAPIGPAKRPVGRRVYVVRAFASASTLAALAAHTAGRAANDPNDRHHVPHAPRPAARANPGNHRAKRTA